MICGPFLKVDNYIEFQKRASDDSQSVRYLVSLGVIAFSRHELYIFCWRGSSTMAITDWTIRWMTAGRTSSEVLMEQACVYRTVTSDSLRSYSLEYLQLEACHTFHFVPHPLLTNFQVVPYLHPRSLKNYSLLFYRHALRHHRLDLATDPLGIFESVGTSCGHKIIFSSSKRRPSP